MSVILFNYSYSFTFENFKVYLVDIFVSREIE